MDEQTIIAGVLCKPFRKTPLLEYSQERSHGADFASANLSETVLTTRAADIHATASCKSAPASKQVKKLAFLEVVDAAPSPRARGQIMRNMLPLLL